MSRVEFSTVAEALDSLADRGFVEELEPAGDRVRSRQTGITFASDEMMIVEVHRFEGHTDPQDMSVVYAIETKSGVRGVIVDAFGAYGSAEVGEALRMIRMHEPRTDETGERQTPHRI